MVARDIAVSEPLIELRYQRSGCLHYDDFESKVKMVPVDKADINVNHRTTDAKADSVISR